MDMIARMASQPPFDRNMFVGCIIVGYDMDVEFCGNVLVHPFQEIKKFLVAVTTLACSDDCSSCNVQGSKKRCCSMTFIGVCHSLDIPQSHR